MRLTHYVKTVIFMLWNMIVFLCPIIAQHNIEGKKKPSFSGLACVKNYFSFIIYNFKEFINNKILKNKNNSTANTLAVPNYINENKNSVSNRIKSNNNMTNQVLKSVNSLYVKRLKDALATQNLISKHYFSRLWDKCAFLYIFVSKNHCSQYNL